MKIRKLTIIMPVYNERTTVAGVYKKLLTVSPGARKELIVVDDGSTDGTVQYLKKMARNAPRYARFLFHDANQGKGAAIQSALKHATGDYVVIQDADLEYDPAEITLLTNAVTKRNGVVYGSRNKDVKNRYIYPHYYWGSKLLTYIINFLYGQKLTDPETCHKLIPSAAMKKLSLTEKGFGIETELIAKIALLKLPVTEVSISYKPRSFKEGKKIRAKDGIRAVYLLFFFRFFGNRRPRSK